MAFRLPSRAKSRSTTCCTSFFVKVVHRDSHDLGRHAAARRPVMTGPRSVEDSCSDLVEQLSGHCSGPGTPAGKRELVRAEATICALALNRLAFSMGSGGCSRLSNACGSNVSEHSCSCPVLELALKDLIGSVANGGEVERCRRFSV